MLPRLAAQPWGERLSASPFALPRKHGTEEFGEGGSKHHRFAERPRLYLIPSQLPSALHGYPCKAARRNLKFILSQQLHQQHDLKRSLFELVQWKENLSGENLVFCG